MRSALLPLREPPTPRGAPQSGPGRAEPCGSAGGAAAAAALGPPPGQGSRRARRRLPHSLPARAPAWPRLHRARSQWATPQRGATPPASRRAPHGRGPAPPPSDPMGAVRAPCGWSRGAARAARSTCLVPSAPALIAPVNEPARQHLRRSAGTAQRDAPPDPTTPSLQRVVQRPPCWVNAGGSWTAPHRELLG